MGTFDKTAWNPDNWDDDDEEDRPNLFIQHNASWSECLSNPFESFVEWLSAAQNKMNAVGGDVSMSLETAREYKIPLDVRGQATVGRWLVRTVMLTESGRYAEGCE